MVGNLITSTLGRLVFGALVGGTLVYVAHRGRMAAKRRVLRTDVERVLATIDNSETDRLIDKMESDIKELEGFIETTDTDIPEEETEQLVDKYFNLAAGMVDKEDIYRAITHKWVLDEDELSDMVKDWRKQVLLAIAEDVTNKGELESVYQVFLDKCEGKHWRLPKYKQLKQMLERDKRSIKRKETMLPARWSGKVKELSASHVEVDYGVSPFEKHIRHGRNDLTVVTIPGNTPPD